MKKSVLLASAAIMMCYFTSCSGGKKTEEAAAPAEEAKTEAAVPEYKLMNDLPTVDLSTFPKDADGKVTLFDGKSFNGWRGYGRTDVPAAWEVVDGTIHIKGSGAGEAGAKDGGDLVFAHKFKNYEFEFEWKVGKGSNSGVLYMIQEVEGQPSYISAPEYQVLDNANHPDAKLGKDGNRQSASLYDMIPAKPQNSKPFGEWNKGKIMCYKGTVVHYQNDEPVVEYHLWTQQWKEMLDNSKFSKDKWPLAYELLLNCGGENKEGFIGFQDHGDDVWYRNITIKELDYALVSFKKKKKPPDQKARGGLLSFVRYRAAGIILPSPLCCYNCFLRN